MLASHFSTNAKYFKCKSVLTACGIFAFSQIYHSMNYYVLGWNCSGWKRLAVAAVCRVRWMIIQLRSSCTANDMGGRGWGVSEPIGSHTCSTSTHHPHIIHPPPPFCPPEPRLHKKTATCKSGIVWWLPHGKRRIILLLFCRIVEGVLWPPAVPPMAGVWLTLTSIPWQSISKLTVGKYQSYFLQQRQWQIVSLCVCYVNPNTKKTTQKMQK